MKGSFVRLIAFPLLVLAGCVSVPAQVNDSAPFAAGETLTYEGKLSKIINGISVADLTFTLGRTGDEYLIKAEARSKGTLLKLLRFSFVQQLESTVDARRFRAVKTVKHDVQKDRVRDSEAVFDYRQKRVTFVESDPKEPMKPPRKIASKIDESTHDLISAIYNLRMQPLAVGKTFEMSISDSGLVYEIPVRVTGRILLKTVLGRVWCFRVEPDVFGAGRLIESKGKMVIWITDDARRIPVRSQVNANIGKLDIKLRSVANVKTAKP